MTTLLRNKLVDANVPFLASLNVIWIGASLCHVRGLSFVTSVLGCESISWLKARILAGGSIHRHYDISLWYAARDRK